MHRPSLMSLACCAAIGLGLSASAAQAADNDITTSFSGYGTVAGTMTSNGKYEYISDLQQFKGATNQLDIGGESRLGLQGTVTYGSQFSVTAQMLARRVGDNDFDIGTEWLFAQYEPTPGLDFRLGRVVLPAFLFSDTRNVGYSQTWLRAPNEVYSLMPYRSLDGAQANWTKAVGPANVSAQVTYGKASAQLADGNQVIDSNASNVVGLALSAELGNWSARISQIRLDSPTDLDLGTFTLAYTIHDQFLSAGLQYDDGTAILLGEWTRRNENSAPILGEPLEAGTQWYVAGGWRFDKFTPMVRYAYLKSVPSLTAIPARPSIGLILRWDVIKNVALKAQVDRYDASSGVVFKNAATTAGTKVNVMSLGADFVF